MKKHTVKFLSNFILFYFIVKSIIINYILIYWARSIRNGMSCPMIDVYCDKCGSKIKHMITLKPIKDILRATKNKCSSCGIGLNPQDFTIELEKFWIGCFFLLCCWRKQADYRPTDSYKSLYIHYKWNIGISKNFFP